MWLELGGNVLVDLDCFSHFSINLYTDDPVIFGVTGKLNICIYRAADADDAKAQFEKIRRALYHKQTRLNNLLGLETDELVSGVGRALREEFEDSIGVS